MAVRTVPAFVSMALSQENDQLRTVKTLVPKTSVKFARVTLRTAG